MKTNDFGNDINGHRTLTATDIPAVFSCIHYILDCVLSIVVPETRTVRFRLFISRSFKLCFYYRYRIPAIISAVIVLVAALAVFIWAIAKQGNGGPLFFNPECVHPIYVAPVEVLFCVLELYTESETFEVLS
jgi:hypothetical protein